MVEQIEEMDLGRCEVLLLQNHHNLTWVPDDMVKECQNSKCRVPFTKVRNNGFLDIGQNLSKSCCWKLFYRRV